MSRQRAPNILLVEDTEDHAMLMKRALQRGHLKPRLFMVSDGKAALDFLYNRVTTPTKRPIPGQI
jgi:CheY-like chemotaxis protein